MFWVLQSVNVLAYSDILNPVSGTSAVVHAVNAMELSDRSRGGADGADQTSNSHMVINTQPTMRLGHWKSDGT